MASNGVILLNLNNRNAAEFQRLSVPDSYEKASGALTAGTYVTVYKWLYQGFMLAPSLCDAVDATDHINLVDRTNGGIIEVYPDDTVTVTGGVAPGGAVIVPLQASSNGVYNAPGGVDGYNPVSIAVPSQSEPIIEPLSVSTNGTFTAPAGIDGYSPITVSVEGSSDIGVIYQVVFTKSSDSVGYMVYGYYITNKIPDGTGGVGRSFPIGVQSSEYTLTSYNKQGQSVQLPITVQYKQYMNRWVWAVNPQRAFSFMVTSGSELTDSSIDPSIDPTHYSIVTGVLQSSSNRYYTADTDRFELLLWEY